MATQTVPNLTDTAQIAFVTGGTGFVGSHLVEALLAQGFQVRCLVRKDLKWLKGLPIEPILGDLHTQAALQKGCQDASLVFHVAALTRSKSWEVFQKENVAGTQNVLEAARANVQTLKRVVLISSQAAAGPGEQPVTEDHPMQPVSMYGRSKKAMEDLAADYQDRLPLTILRPPSVYGPRETDIFEFFKSVHRGLCPIVGKGTAPTLNLVHIRDLITGILSAAQSPNTLGETYFVGSERDYSWHEIRDAVCAGLGKKAMTFHLPVTWVKPLGAILETVAGWFGQYPPLNREKAQEAQHSWRLSIAKAQKAFGYAPKTSLGEGMKETADWYQKNGWL